MKPVYIVTDIEVDGPVAGQNSMMSFASVALDENGQELATFEAVLKPLDGAWIGYYLQRFAGIRFLKGPWAGERLFYSAGLCIRTYAQNWAGTCGIARMKTIQPNGWAHIPIRIAR